MFFFYLNTIEDPEDRFIITRIYNDYHILMGYTAQKILKDHQLAEDAVQQTFVKLINNVSTVKGISEEKIKPYLFVALHNTIVDMLKQNKKYYIDDTLDETQCTDVSVEDEALNNIETQDIIQEINELSENDIIILQLTYLFGLKDKQIAKQLDINISAVKKRRERAKSRLYNRLVERKKIENEIK